MQRREYISSLASLGLLGAASEAGANGDRSTDTRNLRLATSDDTHHPGPPRFTTVGEGFEDEMFIDFSGDAFGKDRDNLAPSIVGDPQLDPDNYDASDFSWSIKSAPGSSSAPLMFAPDDGGGAPQYDSGQHNAVEFIPDVAGEYVLELDAPDGLHDQWIYAFPPLPNDAGGAPRIEIEGQYDSSTDEFVLDANPQLAPNSNRYVGDLEVYWRSDDRDALSFQKLGGTDSWTVRIPKSNLDGETARLHAAGFDGDVHSMTDTVVLDPASESIEYPNRPPEWMEDGIMYQIFPRSFEGPPPSGEWPFENSNANFKNFKDRLDYIESLNVDVIWFTPVVPAESSNWKPQKYKRMQEDSNQDAILDFKYSGGGPHGYDALSYVEVAEDLGSQYSISDYYDEPFRFESGYDPNNNVREDARANAMQEFKDFIQAANDRGIKVCFDLVINHLGRHHEFFQKSIDTKGQRNYTYLDVEEWADGLDGTTRSKYFDWFDRKDDPITDDTFGEIEEAPAETGFADLRVMPNINYANVAMREHILAAADYLSSEVGVDAFRCDIAYGVVHSMWKEIREVVRANDSEFMLLDETIPNDPSMAENEFDMHFDTQDFMGAAHSVAKGDSAAQSLYGAVDKRRREGWPDHTLIVNSTENHDENRALQLAIDNGSRPNPEKAQRAAWAAGVALPGVPFVYYGQERQISKYGIERYDYDGTGEDPRDGDGDVGPGNPARAFMNWAENGDTVPSSHLQFYKDVTAYYHQDPVLKPGAALETAEHYNPNSEADILAFRRRKGDEARLVLVNAGDGLGYIDIKPSVSTTNLLTGNDIAVSGGSGALQRVEFDTIAVLDTPPKYLVELEPPVSDDDGTGAYNYPANPDYANDAFDMTGFRAQDAGQTYRFEIDMAGSIGNPRNYTEGFSVQHIQLYLRDPNGSGGSTTGRAGTNVEFANPYHYRVVVDGKNGVRIEDASGTQLATGTVTVDGNTFHVEFGKDDIPPALDSLEVAPLMLGYHPDKTGTVVPVEQELGWNAFGGSDGSGNAPHVVDMATPSGTTKESALSYTSTSKATLPFVTLADGTATIQSLSDTTGDDTSTYTYPTSNDFQDGAFDVTDFAVKENNSRYRFKMTFDVDYVRNPFDLPLGFSHQFVQIYIRDPDSDGPSTTSGYDGLAATMDQPYHYRLLVAGKFHHRLEAPDGNGGFTTVSNDVNAAVHDDTIALSIPKTAIDGNLAEMDVAPIVAPFDGEASDDLRVIDSSATSYTFGGGTDGGGNDTRIIDAITPAGTSVSDVVSSGTMPYVTVTSDESIGSSADPDNDTLYEDVDGDGDTDTDDAIALFNERNTDRITDNVSAFDFNGNGEIDIGDVVSLFQEVTN